MPAKYRKVFWPTLVLMAVTALGLAFVSAPTRNITPRVEGQSLVAAHGTDKPPLTLTTLVRPWRKAREQPAEWPKATGSRREADVGPQDQPSAEQVEVEVIMVRPNGFEPREITRRQGPFMLAISNHTGATDLALHLERVRGNRLQEMLLPKGRIRWNKVVDLPPGDYALNEQNHPDWICRIRLTAP